MDETTRQSQRVWEADLGDQGRRLSLNELTGLEAMHQCQLLQEIVEAARLQTKILSSLEGRLDRLEQYLIRIDPRYPQSTEQPQLVAPPSLNGPR